jgi:hypothetical protein
MDNHPAGQFAIGNLPGYFLTVLQPKHIDLVQSLFERCDDFMLLVDGEPASPTAHWKPLPLRRRADPWTINSYTGSLTRMVS